MALTAPAPEPDVHDPAEHHVRAALETRLGAMLRHAPGTRSGEDAEDLHQMRVSVRRMRAVLRAARPLLDRRWADGLRAELGWLGRALGPVRDLDVLLLRLREEAKQFGTVEQRDAERLLAALEAEREAARAAMLQALDSQRYADLVERLSRAAAEPLPLARRRRPVALASLVRREFDRLAGAVTRAGDDPPDEVLHELRIDGKRLRYTTELAEPALGRPARELLRKTARMQDVLGEHQDACVAQQRITELLAGLGIGLDGGLDEGLRDEGLRDERLRDEGLAGVAFVAGLLSEREEVRRIEMRAAWPQAWVDVAAAARTALGDNAEGLGDANG